MDNLLQLLPAKELMLEDFIVCESGEYICHQVPGLKFRTLADVQFFLNSQFDEDLLSKARVSAKKNKRTFSAQLEVWIEELMKEGKTAPTINQRSVAPGQ